SSPVARQAHNLKVVGSNPTPATSFSEQAAPERVAAFLLFAKLNSTNSLPRISSVWRSASSSHDTTTVSTSLCGSAAAGVFGRSIGAGRHAVVP
ncbi:hypothetical protein, partial [Pseudooceanicola nanhaiensis]|uniref:hypothetical protein n=1 Tax=Pseudooceanicola nanhaiensis TaxID=375761 RepID=UPI001E4271B1